MDDGSDPLVLLVDDHELFTHSLRYVLAAEGVRARVAPIHSVDAVVAAAAERGPHVVLMDLDLGPTIPDSSVLLDRLCDEGHMVVLLTASEDLERVAEAVERCAVGYLQKSQPFASLLDLVLQVAVSPSLLEAGPREQLVRRLRGHRSPEAEQLRPFERLTPREAAVLEHLADGRPADVIARATSTSLATVRTQIRSVLHKLEVNSQLQAVAMAHRAGWVARRAHAGGAPRRSGPADGRAASG